MTDESTRQPQTEEDAIAEIIGLLKANGATEAARNLRTLLNQTPLVWLSPDGKINIAPMQAGVFFAIMQALNSRVVQ